MKQTTNESRIEYLAPAVQTFELENESTICASLGTSNAFNFNEEERW